MKYIDYMEWHNEQMKDPEYKRGFDALDGEFSVIENNIRKQIEKDGSFVNGSRGHTQPSPISSLNQTAETHRKSS